jgi:hypothetical protein
MFVAEATLSVLHLRTIKTPPGNFCPSRKVFIKSCAPQTHPICADLFFLFLEFALIIIIMISFAPQTFLLSTFPASQSACVAFLSRKFDEFPSADGCKTGLFRWKSHRVFITVSIRWRNGNTPIGQFMIYFTAVLCL